MVDQNTWITRKDEDAEMKSASVSGTLAVTGVLTATGGVVGDVTGDLTGSVSGFVTPPVVAITADGAIAVPSSSTMYFFTKAGVAVMTLVDPTATTHDGIELTFMATTANANTLDLVTGINGSGSDIGTWGGAAGDAVVLIAYQGVWYQLLNKNVTFA